VPLDREPSTPPIALRAGEPGLDCQEVLAHAPFGVLVFDREGRLTGHNLAGERLLGPLCRDGEAPLRCCALLGCRRPASALAGRCILDLVANGHDALPEIRVDLAQDHEPSALWITVTPLAGRRARVLVTVRPGQHADRRRRTNPHWISTPRLTVVALGRTAVASVETPIAGKWLQQRPGQLFKYLLVHRDRLVPIDELAEAFWPAGAHAGLRNVRYFVHVVRNSLEPERARRGPSSFIVAENGGYRLDTARVEIDADRFESLVTAGLAAAAAGDASASASLGRAADLYGGEFLAEEPYADWALAERDRLRSLAAEALRTLARLHAAGGQLNNAAANLKRVAEMDPFDVGVQRVLLSLAIRRGRHSEAKRQYTSLRARMRRHFGEELDFTLPELAADADEHLPSLRV
jgi:DNA-binding SARP family transcriptional activator